jgi:hypothetical protein
MLYQNLITNTAVDCVLTDRLLKFNIGISKKSTFNANSTQTVQYIITIYEHYI